MKNCQTNWFFYFIVVILLIITCGTILNKSYKNSLLNKFSLFTIPSFVIGNTDSFNEESHINSEIKTKTLSLERGHNCRLDRRDLCGKVNKSLVVSFWRNISYGKWLPKNIDFVFPSNYFDHIIMVHDDTNWSSHPGYKTYVWIRVANQIRFWYIKRFLPPHVLRAYNYVWIVDDDAQITFNPFEYECVVKHIGIPFSSPTRLSGPAAHPITQQDKNRQGNIGRWTDFVEIGPVIVGEGHIWSCLWHYFRPVVGAGYGLDFVWCGIINEKCLPPTQRYKACGMLDVFGVHHDSKGLSGVGSVSDDTNANKIYKKFLGQNRNIGLLSENTDILNKCTSNSVKINNEHLVAISTLQPEV